MKRKKFLKKKTFEKFFWKCQPRDSEKDFESWDKFKVEFISLLWLQWVFILKFESFLRIYLPLACPFVVDSKIALNWPFIASQAPLGWNWKARKVLVMLSDLFVIIFHRFKITRAAFRDFLKNFWKFSWKFLDQKKNFISHKPMKRILDAINAQRSNCDNFWSF